MARAPLKEGTGLQSDIRSFGALLSGSAVYAVPYLQRPYEWGEAEVSAMVGDLLSASKSGYQSYFLGHIVGVKNARGHIDIVDGQQRLVTTTILFAHLRDRLARHAPALAEDLQACIEGDRGMRISPRPTDAQFLRKWVQERGRFADLCALRPDDEAEITSDAQGMMAQAARTIAEQLSPLAFEALERFAEFVLDRGVIDYIVAENRTMASILYRGMNMRGKQLSPADLIKLEAIENAGLDEEGKESVARAWEVAEERLRRDNFAFLLEILPLIVSRQTTRRPGDPAEWRQHAFQAIEARTVLDQLLPLYAEVFDEILDGDIQIEARTRQEIQARTEVNGLIRGLLFLQQDRQWIAPAISAVHAHRGRPLFLAKFFRGLDRLTFACFLDGVRHEQREQRFADVVRAGADETQLDHAFALKRGEVTELTQRLRQQFRRDGGRRRAIAARINAALDISTAIHPSHDYTLEHIAPKSQCETWKAVGWGAQQVAQCSNLIGNFALVPKVVNGRCNQKLLKDKWQIIEAHDAPILPITEDLRNGSVWTERMVRDRTERFVKLLLSDWELA